MAEPQQARGHLPTGDMEGGADITSRNGILGLDGRRQDHRDPRGRCDPCSFDLRRHAAQSHSSGADASRGDIIEIRRAVDLRNLARAPLMRWAVVETINVGEQDEALSVHQVGDERRQPVIVTDPDLIRRDRVVLINDRYDAEIEQGFQRSLSIAVMASPRHVISGKQYLPDGESMSIEGGGVSGEQESLTHAGRGLLGRKISRSSAEAEVGESGRDRAAGNNDHLRSALSASRDDVGEPIDPLRIETAAGLSQR